MVLVAVMACRSDRERNSEREPERKIVQLRDAAPIAEPDPYSEARVEMVARTIEARGVTDERVLSAMRLTPRHAFVPPT